MPVLLPLCLLLSAAALVLAVMRAAALSVAALVAEMLVCDVPAVVVVDLVMMASVVVLSVLVMGLAALVTVVLVLVEAMDEVDPAVVLVGLLSTTVAYVPSPRKRVCPSTVCAASRGVGGKVPTFECVSRLRRCSRLIVSTQTSMTPMRRMLHFLLRRRLRAYMFVLRVGATSTHR